MKELKQIICCLLVGLMLINPQILCTAAAEDIALEEPEAILQMEPVHPTDTSIPADTPADVPDVPEIPVEPPVETEAPVETPFDAPVEAEVPVDGEPDAPDDNAPEDIPAVCALSATDAVTTMEELKEAISNAVTGDTITLDASSDFIVNESITIPDGVYLNIQSGSGGFKIAEGITFTTASQFHCRVPMTVSGTWRSKNISYCYDGLEITATGCVVNAFYLRIVNSYQNDGIFSISSGGSTDLELNVDDLSELKAALEHDNPGRIDIYLRMTGDIVLTEDLTIPEKISLHISEGTIFTVGQDVTLTTNGHLICDIPMTVAGMWVNRAQSYCKGSLTVATTGTLENHTMVNVSGEYTVEGQVVEVSGGNRVHVNYTVKSMEELLAVVGKAKSMDSISIPVSEEVFHIDQSVTIPEGVATYVERPLTVDEGVTLTTMERFYCYEPMIVAGTWLCNEYSHCNGGLQITSTGHVENNWSLNIYNYYNNQGIFSAESYASTYLTYYISGEQALSGSIDLPEIFRLLIMPETSGATLTIAEGVTLTTFGSFDCRVPLTVAGTWISNTDSYCRKGLTITSTGKVDSTNGRLHVEGFSTNEGVLISRGWGSFEHATLATTPDELAAAASHTLTGGTIWVSGDGGDFVIDEPLMIPAGVVVEVYQNIQNLRINTELTIDAGATLHSEVPIMAEGTIYNYGAIGARNGLSVTGTIHNYAYIRVNGALTGEAHIVDYEAASRSVYQAYTVDSESALRDVLGSLDRKKWNDIFVPNGLTLTEDTTIPAGVYLEIQSGEFRINETATLITYNNLIVSGDMIVDGYWENYHVNYVYCMLYGDLTTKSVIRNSGHLELYQYCQAVKDGMIDNGAGGTVGCDINSASLDELYSIAEGKSYLPIAVSVNETCTLTLDRDLTIPDGMRLNMWDVDLIVPEGVTFTVCDADVHLGNLHIEGTLVNDGELSVSNITLLGAIENTYSICFGKLVNYGVGHVKNGGVLCGSIDEQCIVEKIERTTGPKSFTYSIFETYDWATIFANAQSGDSFYFNIWSKNAWITISEDTIVPEDITINGGQYKIAEGAVFVTNGTNFSAYEMQVDGSWINNDSVDTDYLTVNGIVHNFGQITSSTVTGAGIVMGNAVTIDNHYEPYTTILNLQDILDAAEPGATVCCYQLDYGNGDSTIINRDIVVPEGVTLVFSGVSKVYLTAGHTLTVNGSLLMPQQLYIAGKLVVNGSITIDADGNGSYYWDYYGMTLGGIQITDSGAYDITGSIRVAKWDYSGQSITDPRTALTGMEAAPLSVQETERYWYLSPDKGAVLCTVENDGCNLRLLDGDDCLWQSASVTDGAVLAGVAPGQYTLEVSRPGYVTRRYTVDTTVDASLSVQLVATGNINGAAVNGCDVEITDLACLYHYLTTNDRTESRIEDEAYFMAVADVNGDSAVDVYDLQRLYEHVSGVNQL